jgi:hypothetical protein
MLWAMEALRIFGDKLLSALAEIREARSNLVQELNKVGAFPENLILVSHGLGKFTAR